MYKKIISPQHSFILIVTLFLMATGNSTFFQKLITTYPIASGNILFLLSITAFFTLATALFLNLICYSKSTPWILAIIVFSASQAAYFMDSYSVVIDTDMLENVLQTDTREAGELINFGFILHTIVFGIFPSYLIFRFCPKSQGLIRELKSKLTLASVLIFLLILVVVPFTSQYASFIREHKTLRFYANPTYFSYSVIQYINNAFKRPESNTTLIKVAQDTKHIGETHKNELMILIIGETARADHFSLNGYERDTNPELKKHEVISFKNVSSCGTSTATSVPCMFSSLKREYFDIKAGLIHQNVLDVLSENGVEILWRDNNSDSKGVAKRMLYEDFKKPPINPICDDECRDIGMLNGLDQYINARKGKDILIVLHQMGNHGPAYYKRYPKEFERFTPTCKTNDLGKCSNEEIGNAYDNAILYTDYFLSNVIKFMQKYDDNYETAMLYVSDHGESLGELGVYLHGAPYAIAPKAQIHVPAIAWFGKNFDYKIDQVKPYESKDLSHDDLFCAMLTAYELDTDDCSTWRSVLKSNTDSY
ncbi:MAG: phosphoethanolamine--lipid A transferase [Methylotenera sp.]|nr:phosphoethanolamine--lipid A transferase [Methylotenera sp.]